MKSPILKLTIAFLLIALAGCHKEPGHHSGAGSLPDPLAGHELRLMSIICCAPDQMKPANADKCTALSAAHGDGIEYDGVLTTMTQSEAACQGLDETPFWGRI